MPAPHACPRFRFPLPLLAALAALAVAPAVAHPVVVDGSPAEWLVRDATGPDTGLIARAADGRGEFIWRDAAGDERTDFFAPDPDVDLRELRLTGDETGLFVLARFADLQLASGDGAVQLQIAVDLDRVPLSGQTWLGGFADTEVAPDAAWERLVVTRFGSDAAPMVWDAGFADAGLATAAIDTIADCIEVHVPWATLGGLPDGPVAFTVAALRGNANDEAWDAGGSDVLDAVTLYGTPGLAANTWDEVADGVLDHHFEVWFLPRAGFQPAAPVLLTEILYDAIGAEPAEEWCELTNVSGATVSLAGWTLTDEEEPGGTEGARSFPVGALIEPGEVLVVANNAAAFAAAFGATADWELVDAEPAIDQLVPAPLWAGGLLALGNSGDQLLLCDAHWTIMDVVTWEGGTYPGITPALGSIGGQSIGRQTAADTDDGTIDFAVLTLPDPGRFDLVSHVPGAGPSGRGAQHLSNHPNPFNPSTLIAYELTSAQDVTVHVYDPRGRRVRTLLEGVPQAAGRRLINWDGRAQDGLPVPAGVYVVQVIAGGEAATRTMVLVK